MRASDQENNSTFVPFFSIVTVVWNNLAGLRLTKETLDRQSCRDLEWLVIDGDSTDGSREFAISCRGRKVRVLCERDRGIYDAMNKGLRMATGEYVIFLNSGDMLASDESLSQVQDACLAERPDVLFCSSVMNFGVIRLARPVKSPAYIWHGQPGLHQATVFRREAHLNFEYDQTYRICGDYDVITRMAHAELKMRSAPILVSENEFKADATSGRKKIELIKEAARAQRQNLHLGHLSIAASALWRASSSLAAKLLTWADLFKRRGLHNRSF
jgi:putative colanic acid biosynthesis glycosyltransferase